LGPGGRDGDGVRESGESSSWREEGFEGVLSADVDGGGGSCCFADWEGIEMDTLLVLQFPSLAT